MLELSRFVPKTSTLRWYRLSRWVDNTCTLMTQPSRELGNLLRSLQPVLHPGTYVYVLLPDDDDSSRFAPLAMFHEAEGTTLIVEEGCAQRANLRILFRCAWLTLRVYSDLRAVGLTAAVATALAAAGVSCNMMAAALHDHVFVPVEQAELALRTLQQLSLAAGKNS